MKNKRIIKIIMITIAVLFVVFLGYNSLVSLSYTKYSIGNYIFLKPKKLVIEKNANMEIKIMDERIIESSMLLTYKYYSNAIELAKKYSFYSNDFEIISEEKEENYYRVEKKVKHPDNNTTTYMSTHIYEINYNTLFVISVEYNNINDMKEMDKTIKKISKSIK